MNDFVNELTAVKTFPTKLELCAGETLAAVFFPPPEPPPSPLPPPC